MKSVTYHCDAERRRRTAWALLALWLASPCGPLALAVPGTPLGVAAAWAQSGGKPGLAIIPITRREGVGAVAAARVEEYLRAMVEAGGQVNVIAADAVESGKVRRAAAAAATPEQLEAQRNLDKADEALIAGRDGLIQGDDIQTAYALLNAAISRYEKHFVELVDFTKLVDAYTRAGDAALRLGQRNDAKGHVVKALTIQPTLVLDRKASDELRELVTSTRETLGKRATGAIAVTANVEGAKVFVDGVSIGDAPCEAKELYQGTHYIQVKKEGAPTFGKAVTVRGRDVKVAAKIEAPEEETTEISASVRFDDIKPFAEKGNFHERIARNMSSVFARQLKARYLLYGTLAKSARGVELHLFLFDATVRKFAALQPVEFAGNLANMQMKILEAEGHVRAAVASFPQAKVVEELPAVYSGAPVASGPEPPPVTTGPTPKPTPDPEPEPKPEPRADPPPEPKPDPTPVSPVVTGPPRPTPPVKDPYAGLVKDDGDGSIVKTWWFWTVLGVVVAGGATAAALTLGKEPSANTNFKIDAAYLP